MIPFIMDPPYWVVDGEHHVFELECCNSDSIDVLKVQSAAKLTHVDDSVERLLHRIKPLPNLCDGSRPSCRASSPLAGSTEFRNLRSSLRGEDQSHA